MLKEKKLFKILAGLFIFASSAVYGAENSQQVFFRNQAGKYEGAEPNFTGKVRGERMFPANDTTNFSGSYVTFSPGARTAWHTHPAGQTMVVVSGVCWTQEWGGTKTEARAGDAIWCPPGVKHWHGASKDSEMTHLVLTGVDSEGKNVVWMEKVTDEQYLGD